MEQIDLTLRGYFKSGTSHYWDDSMNYHKPRHTNVLKDSIFIKTFFDEAEDNILVNYKNYFDNTNILADHQDWELEEMQYSFECHRCGTPICLLNSKYCICDDCDSDINKNSMEL